MKSHSTCKSSKNSMLFFMVFFILILILFSNKNKFCLWFIWQRNHFFQNWFWCNSKIFFICNTDDRKRNSVQDRFLRYQKNSVKHWIFWEQMDFVHHWFLCQELILFTRVFHGIKRIIFTLDSCGHKAFCTPLFTMKSNAFF